MPKPIIKVASIDYDGCLSHASFQQALRDEVDADIAEKSMEHNRVLMERLRGFNRLMVGSNRQDVRGDFQESIKRDFTTGKNNHNGSCFSVLNAMSERLGCQFDPFLLGDLYSQKEHGYTYQQALELQKNHKHRYSDELTAQKVAGISSWAFDHKKVSVIYAQMQKLALENPDSDIEYHFIDDREDIHEAVESFFKANPEMIPGNVKLKTIRYYNSNPDRTSVNSTMNLVERMTIVSDDKNRKANPFYADNLRTWAAQSKDDTGELDMNHEKIYPHLKTVHHSVLNLHTNLQNVVTLTKTTSSSANQFIKSELGHYPTSDAYRKKLVEVFKESWDKQYFAGKISIGYSAVLRGITKELEHHPELLKQVKEDLRAYFREEAQNPMPSGQRHATYRAGAASFREEEFERDWQKFTGANANVFQRAAKSVMQAFKNSKEEVDLPKDEGEGIHL